VAPTVLYTCVVERVQSPAERTSRWHSSCQDRVKVRDAKITVPKPIVRAAALSRFSNGHAPESIRPLIRRHARARHALAYIRLNKSFDRPNHLSVAFAGSARVVRFRTVASSSRARVGGRPTAGDRLASLGKRRQIVARRPERTRALNEPNENRLGAYFPSAHIVNGRLTRLFADFNLNKLNIIAIRDDDTNSCDFRHAPALQRTIIDI